MRNRWNTVYVGRTGASGSYSATSRSSCAAGGGGESSGDDQRSSSFSAVGISLLTRGSSGSRTSFISRSPLGLLERSRSRRSGYSRSRRSSFRGEASRSRRGDVLRRRGERSRPPRSLRSPRSERSPRGRSRPESKRHDAEGGVRAHCTWQVREGHWN
jgi:hypothetical protein